MTYHLERTNPMKKNSLKILLVIFAAVIFPQLFGQDLPVPAAPSGWVNDYAGVFNPSQEAALNRKLNEFEYNNSTQIFIVTINQNDGYPASMLAPMIGEEWGVGQEGKDNGLIVLLDMEDRDVFIATGYGMEEYITDALSKRIIENEMVPEFRQGNYYEGIARATDVMISLVEGKFTPDEYRERTSSSGAGSAIGGIIFMIILFTLVFGSRRRAYGMGGRGSNLPFWIALGMLSGSRHRGGGFGNFSSGSGNFGGFGGGGFGGFSGGGGGSFGGGGAGGSW